MLAATESTAELHSRAGKLPRRDYIILPLLSLLTIVVMLAVAELATRYLFAEREDHACLVNDPVRGAHFKPNCASREKNAEGPWVTYHFNNCGYRSAAECGPKPRGTTRIALMGSSVSEGLFVPYHQTFFAEAEADLTRRLHRRVEFQNLGIENSSPLYVYRRLGEALALNPDVVLFLVTPWDVEQKIDPKQLAERNNPRPTVTVAAAAGPTGLLKRLQTSLIQSRTMLVAQHFLFQNEQAFMKLYLLYGDKADFLRQPFTPAWQKRFEDLDVIVGDMAARVRAAGIPLVIVTVPSRAEAVFLNARNVPSGIDPFAFGRAIDQIAARHGADYIDLTQDFSRIPKSDKLFYVVDGHLTGEGQSVLSRAIVQKLVNNRRASVAARPTDKHGS